MPPELLKHLKTLVASGHDATNHMLLYDNSQAMESLVPEAGLPSAPLGYVQRLKVSKVLQFNSKGNNIP